TERDQVDAQADLPSTEPQRPGRTTEDAPAGRRWPIAVGLATVVGLAALLVMVLAQGTGQLDPAATSRNEAPYNPASPARPTDEPPAPPSRPTDEPPAPPARPKPVLAALNRPAAGKADLALAVKGVEFLKTYCYGCHGQRFEVEGYDVLKRDLLVA